MKVSPLVRLGLYSSVGRWTDQWEPFLAPHSSSARFTLSEDYYRELLCCEYRIYNSPNDLEGSQCRWPLLLNHHTTLISARKELEAVKQSCTRYESTKHRCTMLYTLYRTEYKCRYRYRHRHRVQYLHSSMENWLNVQITFKDCSIPFTAKSPSLPALYLITTDTDWPPTPSPTAKNSSNPH